MGATMADIEFHMKLLRYYRRLVEIKDTERDMYASFGGDGRKILRTRHAFRKELADLYKECKDGI